MIYRLSAYLALFLLPVIDKHQTSNKMVIKMSKINEKIINIYENCEDEILKTRMFVRVGRKYCIVNRLCNVVDGNGDVTPVILPCFEDMVRSLDERRCQQILASSPFEKAKEIGDIMGVKCRECWECDGFDCPILRQQEADDIAAYKQMEATASIEDGDMNRYLLVKGENIFGEEVEDVLDEEEDSGYMGDPGFSSSSDYWSYILG